MVLLFLFGTDFSTIAGMYVLFFTISFFTVRKRLLKRSPARSNFQTILISCIISLFAAPILVVIFATLALGAIWYFSGSN